MKRSIVINEEKKYNPIEEMHTEADKRVGQVFRTMLFFTSMMVIAPISSYFASKKYIFEKYFSIDSDESYIYSVAVTVIVIHLILGAFIYIAWQDANTSANEKKKK
ncbi:vacuolar ATPase assembly integral membrane vma21 [Brachionus plicatilis]|uniref:Vacuolar ATPase assembly integral membrane vma21 n=1 Tax=Brachionus plicatilis TaxID=10195 RepID=A0A3M7SC91_BRAPC|nr:vacuolar ATPase assembly integral membrane vma21 [Brachionus plicatilis]